VFAFLLRHFEWTLGQNPLPLAAVFFLGARQSSLHPVVCAACPDAARPDAAGREPPAFNESFVTFLNASVQVLKYRKGAGIRLNENVF
jgi:hypothetical protein